MISYDRSGLCIEVYSLVIPMRVSDVLYEFNFTVFIHVFPLLIPYKDEFVVLFWNCFLEFMSINRLSWINSCSKQSWLHISENSCTNIPDNFEFRDSNFEKSMSIRGISFTRLS